GQVEQDAPPAAADVEDLLAGPDGEKLADAGELALLGGFQVLVPVEEDAGGVGQLAVEDEGEDGRVVLVVGGDLGPFVLALLVARPQDGLPFRQSGGIHPSALLSAIRFASCWTVCTRTSSGMATCGRDVWRRSSRVTWISIMSSESTPRSATRRVSGVIASSGRRNRSARTVRRRRA